MERIDENIWVLKTQSGGVLVNMASTGKITPDEGKITSLSKSAVNSDSSPIKLKYWGANNLLPNERERLAAANNIIPEMIGTKRDIMLGTGLFTYKEVIETVNGKTVLKMVPVPMPPEMEAFFNKVNIKKYLRRSVKNLIMHANTFTEVVGKLGGEVTSIKAIECRHARLEEQDEYGEVNNIYLSTKWDDLKHKDAKIYRVAKYDTTKKQTKGIYHTGDDLFHNDYYYSPRWWGGKDWIILSNRVPIFHNRNLDNGYLIRWQIEIPKDYFRDNTTSEQSPDGIKKAREAETEARKKFITKLNSFLLAEDGAGRAVITTYEINRQLGKEFPGIKITPFSVDIKDEALLKLFDKSNDANISSQGLPPALASIQKPGRDAASGSETRNSYLLYVATKTATPREILLEPIYLVGQRNGWPADIKIGFRDVELTTLADEPSGHQDVAAAGA